MKIYQNGTVAHSGGNNNPVVSLRGEIKGWTANTARRQRLWLWSVNSDELADFGEGHAVTLTLKELPRDAAVWARMRNEWLRQVNEQGADLVHWVVEWQERGVPHLHAAVYFGEEDPRGVVSQRDAYLCVAWIKVCDRFGYVASWKSQDSKPITGAVGWLKYLAKHASRGAAHYQRQGIPEGWEKSGRMWGHIGPWPVHEPVSIELGDAGYFRVRRIMRAWSRAQAAQAGDFDRLSWLRRAPGMVTDPKVSRYQAVSEWLPEPVMIRLVDYFEREQATAHAALEHYGPTPF